MLSNIFKKFSYLEIGSWEGNSALFILKNFSTLNVVCVDIWEKNNEINKYFENFKFNMEEFKNKFSFFRETSDNFFIKNKEKFDVIYIDGSHKSTQVYKDINNAWNFLNIGGILICDDYFYGNICKDHYLLCFQVKWQRCFRINFCLPFYFFEEKTNKTFNVPKFCNSWGIHRLEFLGDVMSIKPPSNFFLTAIDRFILC